MRYRLLKFIITGGSAAIVEFLTFLLLSYVFGAGEWRVVAWQIISFLSGFIISYTLNKRWVFQVRGNTKSTLVKYALLAGVNVALGATMVKLLVLILPIYIAKVTVMILIALWNYILFQKIIFRSTV